MTTVALAGAGRIAVVHALAARGAGQTVTAVASRTPQRAGELAAELRAATCHFDELPAGADLVVVATPPAHHAAAAMQAILAGVPVLVEKPLCATLEEADALVAAAEATRVPVGYGENLAFAPVLGALAEQVAGLGPATYVEARALQARPDWGGFTTRDWGGGVLFDLGVHPLAVVLSLAGSRTVTSVAASLAGSPDIEVDDLARVELTFADGGRAVVESSWRADHAVWDVQVASDAGVARAELLPDLLVERDGDVVWRAADSPDDLPQLEAFGYVGQLTSFAADAAAGRQPAVGVHFGRTVLELVCAAYLSAGRGGAAVPLPYAGPRDRPPIALWRP